MAADLRGSKLARRLAQALPAQGQLARSNRTAEPARLIAADRPVRNAGSAVEAVDDFPEAIPVTARELEVIETYLSAVLDELSGRAQSDMTDELCLLQQQNEERALASVRTAAKMTADCKT